MDRIMDGLGTKWDSEMVSTNSERDRATGVLQGPGQVANLRIPQRLIPARPGLSKSLQPQRFPSISESVS